jgi:hypothetical protein
MMHQSFVRERDEPPAYLVEGWQLACLPCDNISVNSYDSVDFNIDNDTDIDASLKSRSSSPMAMAIALSRNNIGGNEEKALNHDKSTAPPRWRKQRQQQQQQQQQQHGLPQPQLLKTPCRFFQSKKGCRKGSSCPFDHSIAAF